MEAYIFKFCRSDGPILQLKARVKDVVKIKPGANIFYFQYQERCLILIKWGYLHFPKDDS